MKFLKKILKIIFFLFVGFIVLIAFLSTQQNKEYSERAKEKVKELSTEPIVKHQKETEVQKTIVKETKQATKKDAEISQHLQNEITAHFKGSSEPTALDAVWTSKNTFKVGVVDDGSNRNGYAQYVCAEIRSRGVSINPLMVVIIDIGELVRTDKWVDLGKAVCK